MWQVQEDLLHRRHSRAKSGGHRRHSGHLPAGVPGSKLQPLASDFATTQGPPLLIPKPTPEDAGSLNCWFYGTCPLTLSGAAWSGRAEQSAAKASAQAPGPSPAHAPGGHADPGGRQSPPVAGGPGAAVRVADRGGRCHCPVVDALFCEQEDSRDYLLLVQSLVQRCGIPVALYTDRHVVFRHTSGSGAVQRQSDLLISPAMATAGHQKSPSAGCYTRHPSQSIGNRAG